MASAANKVPNKILEPADRVLIIERVFDAPRELVWDAFTDAKHLRNWMGPKEFPASHFEADVRPGGTWRGTLRAANGDQTLGQFGTFRDVVRPHWLSYTFQWEKTGPDDETFETLITVTFEELGDKTLMNFHQAVFNTKANCDGHGRGWNSGFDRLADYLKEMRRA